MVCDLDIELWKFRDIYFQEDTHTYTDSLGTKYTSVTKFVHEFCVEQDWDKIAEKYAIKHNMSVSEVKDLWDKNKNEAASMGTQVHSYMENLWKRKEYRPVEPVGDYELVRKSGLEAYNRLYRWFVPIRNEFIVYNPEWALCGTIDYLCWDRREDCIAILDWKTNKEIKKENPFQQCIGPLKGLPDCNYIHYSAQLSTYKLLIERMTNLRVGELALVHLKRDGWEYIPCRDFSVEIGAYLVNRKVETLDGLTRKIIYSKLGIV